MSAESTEQPKRVLGLGSGIGLVIANMVGAGVFLSTGYMAQNMGSGAILLAWLIGAVIALAGARAYATVAEWVPKSGGEFRYLSELLHPSVGYVAGWASLLLGFSAPIAVNVMAAGSFLATVVPGVKPLQFALVIAFVLTIVHAVGLRISKWTQNTLVVVDSVLLLGFVAVGLFMGRNEWPSWVPPSPPPGGFPWGVILANQLWIAFAFSGWNAAVYASQEFKEPTRDVPRAMIIGCSLVAVLYLVINWVFVANLTPERAAAIFDESSRITLGHVVMKDLLGAQGGMAMSILSTTAFLCAASAMTFAGPRIYAAMARDGFLPRALAGRDGAPPVWAILLQGAITLGIVATQTLADTLNTVGGVLTLFAALVSCTIFRVRFGNTTYAQPTNGTLVAAAIHVIASAVVLYYAFKMDKLNLKLLGVGVVVVLVAYAVTRLVRPDAGRERPEPVAS